MAGSAWLCGDGNDFWNASSWDRSRNPPLVGPCLHLVAWTLPPAALFWLLLPLASAALAKPVGRSITWSYLMISKLVVIIGLFGIAIFDLAKLLWSEEVAVVDILEPCIRMCTLLTVALFTVVFRRKGIFSPGILWVYWMAYTVTSVVLLLNQLGHLRLENYSFVVSAVLIAVNFVLHFWADSAEGYRLAAEADEGEPCPEEWGSFPSQLTFAWFSGLAWQGFKRTLAPEDLWRMPTTLKSEYVHSQFEQNWIRKRQKKKKKSTGSAQNLYVPTEQVMEMKSEAPAPAENETMSAGQSQVGVMSPIMATFGATFISGSTLKLLHDCLLFVPPMLLQQIIAFVDSDDAMWRGVFFCGLLLVTATTQTLMLSQYFYKMYLIGLKIRSALILAVYKKSLRLSLSSKMESSTGETVNIMSVDVQRIVDMMPYLNMLWSAPLQIVGAVYFLWLQLGPSVLAGLFTMILLIPVNGFIAAKSKTFQIGQMKEKDKRVKVMNEIITGIKILKLYAWEPSFESKVRDIRHKEVSILRRMGYLQAGTSFVWSCAPFVVSLVSFATYVLVDEDHVLDSKKAFVSLSLFNILRFPLTMLPMMITGLVQANVSVKRINKFMASAEIKDQVDRSNHSDGVDSKDNHESIAMEMKGASFSWDGVKNNLTDLTFRVPRGSFVAVVGTVGAGKSSVLSALLGEMEKTSGEVRLHDRLSYVPQQAFIQNATVRDNILFGQPLDRERYDSVLKHCALEDDLAFLPAGDETEIGEKGINLSGGQKQRVSLARAVYASSDVFLLDDPLSAVDSHVGRYLFDHVIGPKGCLSNKTRLLVTHGITFLPQVDLILVIKDGVISETGTYKELLEQKGAFAEFLVQYLSEETDQMDAEEDIGDMKKTIEQALGKEEFQKKMAECRKRTCSFSESHNSAKENDLGENEATSKQLLGDADKKELTDGEGDPVQKGEEKKDVARVQYQEEKMETGTVSYKVYLYYLSAMGFPLSAGCFLSYVVYQICSALSSVWLAKWSDAAKTSDAGDRDVYLGVYGALGFGQAVAAIFGSACLYLGTLKGSEYLHFIVLRSILRSPMSFFDTTPQGRILNRFGKDIDVLDATMPMILRGWITCFLAVISTFVIISYTTPIFILPFSVVLIAYYMVQRIYVATSRQLKRLESVSRSPIYSHFGETIAGLQTIRAFSLQQEFSHESARRLDYNQKANFPGIVANRWLAVRLEMVGNLIIFCSALFAVVYKDSISPGLVGLSVSYALSVTQTLNWLVRMTSEVETNIVAVERLKEYAELPTEADLRNDRSESLATWPSKGKIDFEGYSTKYREGLALALSNVSFTCSGCERVGIVGRTGAGKSSLTMGLFRLIEPVDGKIKIDDIDISSIGLHDLREKLSIIPQDPVLFSGTLRLNLDPFHQYTDEELRVALKQSHLGDFFISLENGLEHEIFEGGTNLSVGQRQLVCLARAILRRSKILVLDEATAAVDLETDEIIQTTIREKFKDCTIITIAHRLNTIMDYNKIAVLSAGRIVEFDTPENLLKQETSLFYKMCKESNLV